MKLSVYTLLLSAFLLGCKQKENVKMYPARDVRANENFIDYQADQTKPLTISKYNQEGTAEIADETAVKWFGVKFADTTVKIQLPGAVSTGAKFASAQFVNTQKTCVLVQIADSTDLVAPFYLIAANKGKLEVISLFRASDGRDDKRFTKGLIKVGRSGYLINNDFLITTVDAKIYPVKRQHEGERIQGLYFINSPDRKTLVFLVSDALYQVHYPTGAVFTQQLSSDAPKNPEAIFKFIQDNYSWQKNAKGISFLKANNDDRIIDISAFKKQL